ncbi:MAG: serine acetyltransferase [Lentisphaerae bacterium]|nr:serine acetyltransferase [Lentisphaerota bacterium]
MPVITDGLRRCRDCPLGIHTRPGLSLPAREAVHDVLDRLISVLFPGCHRHEAVPADGQDAYYRDRLREVAETLKDQIRRAYAYQYAFDGAPPPGDAETPARRAVTALVQALPRIQETYLQRDIMAAYEGDPAARSTMEVVISYPGVYAVIVHRLAHLLYEQNVPLVPRIMSEHAHALTGIDIHPGARIGPGFFIDHGTGVVIGETCVIGANVKLYQGVTLGALSFAKDADGRLVKGIKRHPDVGDNVVIYAGATILGGDTVIGSDSEIGGNVWLTHSVPPGSSVYNRQPRPLVRRKGDAPAP